MALRYSAAYNGVIYLRVTAIAYRRLQ